MSEKDTNEILEEQRRARQEFLELKKMQSGEMAAPPKPSEVLFPKRPRKNGITSGFSINGMLWR